MNGNGEKSHIDPYGRLLVSGEDYMRLAAEWDASHGMPRNSGELVVCSQWINQQVLGALRGTGFREPDRARRYFEQEWEVSVSDPPSAPPVVRRVRALGAFDAVKAAGYTPAHPLRNEAPGQWSGAVLTDDPMRRGRVWVRDQDHFRESGRARRYDAGRFHPTTVFQLSKPSGPSYWWRRADAELVSQHYPGSSVTEVPVVKGMLVATLGAPDELVTRTQPTETVQRRRDSGRARRFREPDRAGRFAEAQDALRAVRGRLNHLARFAEAARRRG